MLLAGDRRPPRRAGVLGRVLDDLTELLRRFPALTDVVEPISELRARTVRVRRNAFFEPRSLVVVEGGKPRLAAVGIADFNAWRRHVSDGSTVRMRALEDGMTTELVAGRPTSAMAVARAHMEVAGLAAYCCRALYDVSKSGDFTSLEKVILQTYFGSSMRIQVKGTPELDVHLRPEEVRPLRVGDLIKSMDAFLAAGDQPGTQCQLTYGLLSEYAHPAMRATSTFSEVLSENADGWYIRYHEEDRLDDASAEMALTILLDNMRIGHASSALLNLANVIKFEDSYRVQTPAPTEVHDVFVNLLQQPSA
jgi:hypothetical protein